MTARLARSVGRTMKKVLISVLLVASLPGLYPGFLFLSSGNVVRSACKTYPEAAADNLFLSGWLPDIIPFTSFDFTTSNKLDTNESIAEFCYPPSETESFLRKLTPYKGRKPHYANHATLLGAMRERKATYLTNTSSSLQFGYSL